MILVHQITYKHPDFDTYGLIQAQTLCLALVVALVVVALPHLALPPLRLLAQTMRHLSSALTLQLPIPQQAPRKLQTSKLLQLKVNKAPVSSAKWHQQLRTPPFPPETTPSKTLVAAYDQD